MLVMREEKKRVIGRERNMVSTEDEHVNSEEGEGGGRVTWFVVKEHMVRE